MANWHNQGHSTPTWSYSAAALKARNTTLVLPLARVGPGAGMSRSLLTPLKTLSTDHGPVLSVRVKFPGLDNIGIKYTHDGSNILAPRATCNQKGIGQ